MIWMSMKFSVWKRRSFLFWTFFSKVLKYWNPARLTWQQIPSNNKVAIPKVLKNIGSILLSLEFLPKKVNHKLQNQSMDKHQFFLVQCPTGIWWLFDPLGRGPTRFGRVREAQWIPNDLVPKEMWGYGGLWTGPWALRNLQDDVSLIRQNVTFFRIFCCKCNGQVATDGSDRWRRADLLQCHRGLLDIFGSTWPARCWECMTTKGQTDRKVAT